MYRLYSSLFVLSLFAVTAVAQTTFKVTVSNNSTYDRANEPVVVSLKDFNVAVKSALVTLSGQETPCQLDDIDCDGRFDELCFMTNIDRKSAKTYTVTLYNDGTPRQYEPKVFAELMLRNNKIKEKNKQDLYLTELTVNRGVNPYQTVHHHGVAFENELLCMRIYFDHRQTVDLYGKYNRRLELKDTQFYPSEEQKAQGYGDDILFAGTSYGLGALRGWDGEKQTMLTDVCRRSQRIIANGPLRTIIEIEDYGWSPQPGMEPLNMKTHYMLYAGRRDCTVKVMFEPSKTQGFYATGFTNIGGNSAEYTDRQGLRGCWGTAWPVAFKDTANHKRETVGLGINIPLQYIVSEKPASKDEYTYVVKPVNDVITYLITYSSANETFGYHNQKDWFAYLKEWKKSTEQPLNIHIER